MSATGTPPSSASRWAAGAALLLSITLVAGVLVAAALVRGQRPDPLRLAAVPAPAADSADCARLLAALPPDLADGTEDTGDTEDTDGVPRRELAAPVPAGAAAWGEPPVILRCGLDRPPALTASSRLLDISGVQFLDLTAGAPGRPGGSGIPAVDVSTWVAVDRPVYVVVELPPEMGSGPLQQIAGVMGRTLPRRDLDLPR